MDIILKTRAPLREIELNFSIGKRGIGWRLETAQNLSSIIKDCILRRFVLILETCRIEYGWGVYYELDDYQVHACSCLVAPHKRETNYPIESRHG